MQAYINISRLILLVPLLQSTLGKYERKVYHGPCKLRYKFILHITKLIFLCLSCTGVEEQGLQLLNTFNRYQCLYPGDTLTYECTVMGEPRGSTVWRGSVLNCISQEIALFHADYESTEGAYGECGDIVGQSVRSISDINAVNGNSTTVTTLYISRLTVPINSGTMGMTIECFYDDGAIASYTSGKRNSEHHNRY